MTVAGPTDPAPGHRQASGLCVLLVDDEEDNRDLYAQYLEFHGVRTHSVATALDGIAAANQVRPDVIVMDLGMPGMDGCEATRQLKSQDTTRGIPVVVLSAHVYAADRRQALLAGGDAFLGKPCSPSELLEVVRRMASGVESSQA